MSPRFEVRDGVLVTLDDIGTVVHRHPPIATRIVQVPQVAERLNVREDYHHLPQGVSNLYCLDARLLLVWSAELSGRLDPYANQVIHTAAGLVCTSWERFSCAIDPDTGSITHREFTK